MSDSAATYEWDAAGSAALRSQLFVQPAFDEELEFPADATVAATYRFRMNRGDKIDVEIRTERGSSLFADVFEVIDSTMFRHVYAPDDHTSRFSYVATGDGEHILRLQPPVHGGGRYNVHVSGGSASALTFPVEGASPAAIAGQWGDARDGGARDHKGVDIFAPRGTPVLAVANGTVITVESTTTGGRVVWERDDVSGLLYFYAHLDEQMATAGKHVDAGDVIGTVGNTGNASGGSTHLHFGVFLPDYVAQNPTPYLLSTKSTIAMSDAQPIPQLGTRVRTTADHIRLRTAPGEGGPVIGQIDAGTELLVLGCLNGWTRVVMADGKTGFIAAWLLTGDKAAGTR